MKNASKKQYQMDIDEFTMMDDLFLSTMLDGHPDVVEEMLLPIIGKDMKITEAVTQRVENNLFGRAVRLDVLAVHVNKKKLIDTAVNIEVENWGQDAKPSRARYNHAMMDTTVTAKGLAWDELPETYVILIYRHDYFKKGYALYHIENIVRETGEIFDDKAHIIYVNGDYKNTRTKIGKLIHDLRCQNPDDMYNQKIAERARSTKSERKERNHMCEALERQYAEGEAKGIRTAFQIALEFMTKEEAIKKTAEMTEKSINDVKKILRQKPSLI